MTHMKINLQPLTWKKISTFFEEFGITDSEYKRQWTENNIYPIVSNYLWQADTQQNRDLMNEDVSKFVDTKLLPVLRDKRLKDILG